MIRMILLLGLMISNAAYAQPAGDFAIKGAGSQTCKSFLGLSEKDDEKLKLFGGWLEGYITSVNMHSKGTYDVTSFESTTLLLKLIYSLCKNDPDQTFFSAANKIIIGLGPARLKTPSKTLVLRYRDKIAIVYEDTYKKMKERLRDLGYEMSEQNELTVDDVKGIIEFQVRNGLEMSGLPDEATLMEIFYKIEK